MAWAANDKRHPIKLASVGFPRLSRYDNFLLDFLQRHYETEEDPHHPDIIISSCWSIRHLLYSQGTHIYTTIENVAPNFNACDYAITSTPLSFGKRHLWLPPCFSLNLGKETPSFDAPGEKDFHRRFCSFIYSSSNRGRGSVLRRQFCQKLMHDYAPVDCPGQVLHNMDAPELSGRWDNNTWHESKIRFLSHYKFTIAFENSNSPGYLTEKLMDAFMGNTIPIYWGGGGDTAPFPKEAMIYAPDFPNWDALIQRIREINENRELYLSILAANPLRHGLKIDKSEELARFIKNILSQPHGDSQSPTACDKPFGWGDAVIFRSFIKVSWLVKLTVPLGLLCYLGLRTFAPFTWGKWRHALRQLQGEIGDYIFIAWRL